MIGETVGAYNIVSELGRGGMGVVYLAEHRHLGRRAAIKFLLQEFTQKQELLHRFFTEARAASLIEHEGIVRVLDCDVHSSGHAYIVMEYLEGQTLRAYLAARGTLPYPEAAAIVLRVADALAAAHSKGIVHRDLKPDNIFLLSKPAGVVKIVDFGIAKLTRADDTTRTLAGALMGTPLYMSPEQARGAGTVDARTDVYSLGCILFELLAGRPPFVQDGTGELIAAHMSQPPPPLEPTLPIQLRMLVEGMLAKAPEDRPAIRDKVMAILQVVTTGRTAGFEIVNDSSDAVLTPRSHPPAVIPVGTPTESTAPPAGDRSVHGVKPGGRMKWAIMPLAMLAAAGVALGVWRPWDHQDEQELPLDEPEVAAAPLRPVVIQETPPAPAIEKDDPVVMGTNRTAARKPADSSSRSGARARTRSSSSAKVVPPRRQMAQAVRGGPASHDRTIRVQLVSDPPGSYVCLPATSQRLGITNGTVEVRRDTAKTTLLLYHPGYHIERVTIASDEDLSRTIRMRPLTDDDLQAPPPCR